MHCLHWELTRIDSLPNNDNPTLFAMFQVAKDDKKEPRKFQGIALQEKSTATHLHVHKTTMISRRIDFWDGVIVYKESKGTFM